MFVLRRNLLLIFTLCLVLFGCVNAEEHQKLKADYDAVKTENESLRSQVSSLEAKLDELENGAERLLAKAKLFFDEHDYDQFTSIYNKLIEKHPESKEVKTAKNYLSKIEAIKKKEKAEALRKEKARKAEEARKKKAEEARLKKSLKSMKIRKDKVEGITWYTPYKSLTWHKYIKSYGGTEAPLSLYIGKRSTPWLRMKLYYESSDWLFVKKAIAFVDGAKLDLTYETFERDNSGGDIWEWSDVSPTDWDLTVIERIINSKEAIIRFYGNQYYNDRVIKKRHKQALQEALDAFKLLKQTN